MFFAKPVHLYFFLFVYLFHSVSYFYRCNSGLELFVCQICCILFCSGDGGLLEIRLKLKFSSNSGMRLEKIFRISD